jgi:hypothetical protein
MDRAVANGITLESPHYLDLFQSRIATWRLDTYSLGMKNRFVEEKVVGSKLERARNRKCGPEFSRRAPLQEMKQKRSAGPFNALYR